VFLEVLGDVDDVPLQEFNGHGENTALEEKRHRLHGFFKRGKGDDQRPEVGRLGHELDSRPGDDAQRPLGPDQEMEQTVAGAALDELPAQVEDVAFRRDDFQAADIVADAAVLDGPAAPRIGGDEPAQHGAFIARMGREVKPGVLDRPAELTGPRPASRYLVRGVDLLSPGSFSSERRCLKTGTHPPADPVVRRARHRNPLSPRQAQDRGDLVGFEATTTSGAAISLRENSS
jgi:hypothetical protein